MPNDTTHLIFDFGGVLMHGEIDEITPVLAERRQIDREPFCEESLRNWISATTDPAYDRIFWEGMSARLGTPLGRLKEEFTSLTRADEDVITLARALRRRYPLAMLTNQIRSWHLPLMKRFGLDDLFSTVVTSYDERMLKPDARIYERLLGQLPVGGEACIYIDDRPANLIPAQTLGMKTILFRDADGLRRELGQMGIALE